MIDDKEKGEIGEYYSNHLTSLKKAMKEKRREEGNLMTKTN